MKYIVEYQDPYNNSIKAFIYTVDSMYQLIRCIEAKLIESGDNLFSVHQK